MKGPFERLKYDLRRVWECPACGHRERTSGAVTSLFCRCQENIEPAHRRCMKLIANGVRRTGAPVNVPQASTPAAPSQDADSGVPPANASTAGSPSSVNVDVETQQTAEPVAPPADEQDAPPAVTTKEAASSPSGPVASSDVGVAQPTKDHPTPANSPPAKSDKQQRRSGGRRSKRRKKRR